MGMPVPPSMGPAGPPPTAMGPGPMGPQPGGGPDPLAAMAAAIPLRTARRARGKGKAKRGGKRGGGKKRRKG